MGRCSGHRQNEVSIQGDRMQQIKGNNRLRFVSINCLNRTALRQSVRRLYITSPMSPGSFGARFSVTSSVTPLQAAMRYSPYVELFDFSRRPDRTVQIHVLSKTASFCYCSKLN
jgi:hypothetical protein